MATAGHLGIETPRSAQKTYASIDADDLSFGSKEGSFVSPHKQPPAQKFLARLQKPTGSTPLAELKNGSLPARNKEFTPLLKSAVKSDIRKRAAFTKTPSKLKYTLAKSASTSDLPEMESTENESAIAEENSHMPDSSNASMSFQKLPARSPGSNEGAAQMTLREQEKVPASQIRLIIGHRRNTQGKLCAQT